MNYPQLTDGDYEVPIMRGYRLMCCGCSLVHRFDFFVTHYKGGHRVSFRIRLDKKATAAARAARKRKKSI